MEKNAQLKKEEEEKIKKENALMAMLAIEKEKEEQLARELEEKERIEAERVFIF